ncbi:hypothetical protein LEP1GSC188_5187 [Leptospira weilii serovar Topaz str. LT2116]|uniref:Transposase n=1 Tax=Leptospira weilii serovar Topaz str. LT2116 TaxID=1088540 RepID=M3FJ12_9LEPT|nr:hypothetical protein LEP1GSC188_5187 [Leptospira weilii serovar Topaz str. LT2116]
MRNSRVLKPEILSLDKAYANNAIKHKLKKRKFNIEFQIKRMQEILNGLLH